MRELLNLSNRLAELERRFSQTIRHAPVHEVNAAEGWVRLKFGEGKDGPILSDKVPYAQMAGGLKVHAPPTKGQQMTMIAPAGDPAQAVAMPMTWSDKNASPSGKGDENVLTFGDVRIELKGGGLSISVGGVSFSLSADGFKQSGGRVEHDGQNIGSTHVHGGILPGGADTKTPH